MKKAWFVAIAIPFASYGAFLSACSSSSSGGNNNTTDGGPGGGGTDGGGNPGTDGGGNPGTDGGGGGTDSGTPMGTNPIQGIGTPTVVVMDVGGGGGYLDAPRFWGGKLYASDPLINGGNGVQYAIDVGTATPAVFRDNSNATTGTAIDSKTSTLIATEAKTADVVRLLTDGGTTLIANSWDAGAGPLTNFDSPNDLTMRKSDGTIYVTDPGFQAVASTNHVFRIGPSGAVRAVDTCTDACNPNGLVISPKEDFLYVSYSYVNAATPIIKKFPINADGTLGASSTFVAAPGAEVDGMAIDDSGNVYAASKTAVSVYAPTGQKWPGDIKLPGNVQPVHVAFGGADRKTLYIVGGANAYSVTVGVPGRVE